jgi:hypothetical protein
MKTVLVLFQKLSLIFIFVFIFGFLFSCQNEDISEVQENIDELFPESILLNI